MMGTKSCKSYRRAAIAAAFALFITAPAAQAGGWSTVHKYVKRTGQCAGQEILASYYSSGKRTATGERFDANGNTAAARTWALGTHLTVTNPHNGRTLTVRINDRGPYGIAFTQGARLDLAHGAARRLGMSGAQYVCITEGGATVTAKAAPRRRHAAPAAKVMTAQETTGAIP
jgi:rare lipoprotein A (peptidoglycan hydrolase)